VIDFRSDTVTRPGPAMRRAIADAEVGDDVWGDDPTVHRLEEAAAELLGKEAAVFVPSGTQSNLCALMAHCRRGDEYIVGEHAHTYRYEAGGGAVLGSIQPQPVRVLDSGELDLDHVRAVIKPDDDHFADSRLLALENTHNGKPSSLDYQKRAAALAAEHGLALHLDGARLWNAAVALGVAPADVAEPFDTVSVCLSKGLGAPVGSVLVGRGDLIRDARKWRKMLGGGMRQAGIIAAAGLYALTHNIDRLADDHARAGRLAEGLGAIDGVTVGGQFTNMVFVDLGPRTAAMVEDAATNGILISGHASPIRMVTHLDINDDDIETTLNLLSKHQ
jgi:threonine aldolase